MLLNLVCGHPLLVAATQTVGTRKTLVGTYLEVEWFQVVRAEYFGQSIDCCHIDGVWIILAETGAQQFLCVCIVDANVTRCQNGIFARFADDSWLQCFDVLFVTNLFE